MSVIENLRQNMLNVIRQQAQEQGVLIVNTSYADGNWEVRLYPDGYLQLGGYAQVLYPHGTQLEDLKWEDLGRLLDSSLD
jgi:hypothetical protein